MDGVGPIRGVRDWRACRAGGASRSATTNRDPRRHRSRRRWCANRQRRGGGGQTCASRARTDSVGRFLLAALPAGALDLTFRRLAFEPVIVTIDLPADDTTEVEVKLTVVAQRLTGVVVNDRAPKKRVLEGFETRRRQGIGYFMTRAQIEKRDPRLLSDMLRMIPGTILIAGEAGRITLRFTRSARNCPPQFFVDGIQASGMGIDDIAPGDVEGVEIFAGAAGLPSEYGRMRSTSNCGTVLIWTRIPG